MVIGSCSSVQWAILAWCLLCSGFSFSPLFFFYFYSVFVPWSSFFSRLPCFLFNVLFSVSFSVTLFLVSNLSSSPPEPCTNPSSSQYAFYLFLPTVHPLFSCPFFFLAVSDGSLYSAMSSVEGHSGSIRRTFGSQKLLKTENVWLLSE